MFTCWCIHVHANLKQPCLISTNTVQFNYHVNHETLAALKSPNSRITNMNAFGANEKTSEFALRGSCSINYITAEDCSPLYFVHRDYIGSGAYMYTHISILWSSANQNE